MLKRRNIEIQEPPSPLQEANGQSPVALMTLEEVMVNIKNPSMHFVAVQSVRKLLSRERNPPIDVVIDQGLVPVLVHFLGDFNNSGIQFEAAWALTNIASGTSEQTKTVISAGAVPSFIALLRSPVANVAEQAVWALGEWKIEKYVEYHNFMKSLRNFFHLRKHFWRWTRSSWYCFGGRGRRSTSVVDTKNWHGYFISEKRRLVDVEFVSKQESNAALPYDQKDAASTC